MLLFSGIYDTFIPDWKVKRLRDILEETINLDLFDHAAKFSDEKLGDVRRIVKNKTVRQALALGDSNDKVWETMDYYYWCHKRYVAPQKEHYKERK